MSRKQSIVMTPTERRASMALASLFATRMLGLFLLLPVFSVAAKGIQGGDHPWLVGLAMGAYGLTQLFMQIPFGWASDRWGRRPIVWAGLSLFIVGSVICALASSIEWIIIGRAVQGSGAISAAISAWLADLTRPEVRTKGMAMVGMSIALSFALSLVLAPVLVGVAGLSGLFWAITVLGVLALLISVWVIPVPPTQPLANNNESTSISDVLKNVNLLRMNAGVFVLHTVQMAMFMVVPSLLIQRSGLVLAELWKIYLPVIVLSVFTMFPLVFFAERYKQHIRVLRMIVFCLLLVLCAFAITVNMAGLWGLICCLLGFFICFNVLEALQPSLVSRLAPPELKGLAMGVYNTSQAGGLFVGGVLGGRLAHFGDDLVFYVTAVFVLAWLYVVFGTSQQQVTGDRD